MTEKRKKFVELAERRVSKAIQAVRLIGNLSNKAAYDYSDEDIRKIFKALQKELDNSKVRFSEIGAKSDDGFKL